MIATVQRFTRPGTPILTATHAPVGWVFADVPDTISPIATLAGRRAVVFSGIAGGDAFAQTVASLGVNVTATRSFGDHHEYTDTDLRDLVGLRGDGDLPHGRGLRCRDAARHVVHSADGKAPYVLVRHVSASGPCPLPRPCSSSSRHP